MKIRSSFALLAGAIVLIPFVMFLLGSTLWSFSQPSEPLPEFGRLPTASAALIDAPTWEQVRSAVGNRSPQSEVLVFDPSFRLIWGSGQLHRGPATGSPLSLPDAVRFLQGGTPSRDILIFQPAGTAIWIVQIHPAAPRTPVEMRQALGYFLVFLLAVLVVAVALALVVGRSLAASVVRLEKAARQLAEGDLKTPVAPQRGNVEIQSLGAALETVRQSLAEEEARQNRFVMGVSHDLKTPLALIKGYVELLQDGPAGSPEARQSRFELILDKVDQLDGMIDQLIDYSKVNTDDWRRTWKRIALGPFLGEFCRSLEPDARLLDRTLVWEGELAESLAVVCDPRSIRRCLENLVHNALRYSHPGGTVGVRARTSVDQVELTVWDDGPGIAAQDLPHLFDPFYRGTSSRQEEGLGLGLSVVKSLLDSHGWTVRAESAQGARFIITLPVAAPLG